MAIEPAGTVENTSTGVPVEPASPAEMRPEEKAPEISAVQTGQAEVVQENEPASEPLTGPGLIRLLVTEAPLYIRSGEYGLGSLRSVLQQLRSYALQATNPHLRAADRKILEQQVRLLLQKIFHLAFTARIAKQRILRPGGVKLSIEFLPPPIAEEGEEEASAAPVPQAPEESAPIRVPVRPPVLFEIPGAPLNIGLLNALDISTISSALAAIQILNREIEQLTDLQFLLTQTRQRVQELLEEGAALSEEHASLTAARGHSRGAIQAIYQKPRSVLGAQANLKAHQVLELIS